MDKKELAVNIYNNLVDDLFIDELIDHREDIIKVIENNLSSYLIIAGGNILKDDKGNIRI